MGGDRWGGVQNHRPTRLKDLPEQRPRGLRGRAVRAGQGHRAQTGHRRRAQAEHQGKTYGIGENSLRIRGELPEWVSLVIIDEEPPALQ